MFSLHYNTINSVCNNIQVTKCILCLYVKELPNKVYVLFFHCLSPLVPT